MKNTIIIGDDPRLRKTAAPVDSTEIADPQMQEFLDNLESTMESADGLGLAAPQVDFSQRIIAVKILGKTMCLINPVISNKSEAKISAEEGCLSFPGLFGKVARHERITVNALDRAGKKLKFDLADMDARVVQHEYDHLEGVLLIDRLKEKNDAPVAELAGQTL